LFWERGKPDEIGLRGNVVAEVKQCPDVQFQSHINPGEDHSSIVLTALSGGEASKAAKVLAV